MTRGITIIRNLQPWRLSRLCPLVPPTPLLIAIIAHTPPSLSLSRVCTCTCTSTPVSPWRVTFRVTLVWRLYGVARGGGGGGGGGVMTTAVSSWYDRT